MIECVNVRQMLNKYSLREIMNMPVYYIDRKVCTSPCLLGAREKCKTCPYSNTVVKSQTFSSKVLTDDDYLLDGYTFDRTAAEAEAAYHKITIVIGLDVRYRHVLGADPKLIAFVKEIGRCVDKNAQRMQYEAVMLGSELLELINSRLPNLSYLVEDIDPKASYKLLSYDY